MNCYEPTHASTRSQAVARIADRTASQHFWGSRVVIGHDHLIAHMPFPISKAFDKVNHSALFVKLTKRQIPLALLSVLENWHSNSWTCIKWHSVNSRFIKIEFSVRQGSVLSPSLFDVYSDDIISLLPLSQRYSLILGLYADDILIIAPSVTALQSIVYMCKSELNRLDLLVNVKKSCCMRVGQHHDASCAATLCDDNTVTRHFNGLIV